MTQPAPEIAELVARCVALAESEGDAAVERVCADHPELLASVRERLASLEALGLLGPGHAPPSAGRQLGPFRLLARLGGGGMGEVHLATQEGLDREVALKLVRPDHLPFSGARERFRREAEAVARLKHPGIVPVYTVGEEGGVPYLAMECVEGATLDEVLADLAGRDPASLGGRDLERSVDRAAERLAGLRGRDAPTASSSASGRGTRGLFRGSWVEAVLRLGLAVTEALQHAHDQGVLHRDVKPSNLMVTRDGRVLLLDFGLALRTDGERLTRTGAVLGSLAYMPPEQVRGDRALDGRADVYALGATLFELLALRPPFVAPHAEALRQAILAGGPPSVRQANPSVGRDAATLLAVALSARPDDRYATAAELGADLLAVLERRPLRARPPSLLVRGVRWVQRRPALSAALVLAVLLVVGGPLVVAELARRHADEMMAVADQAREAARRADSEARRANALADQAATRAAEAEAAREETARHFGLARQAVDDLLVEVSQDDLFEQPGLLDVRRRVLERALRLQDALIAARPDDDVLALEGLELREDLVYVLRRSGRLDEARALAAACLGALERSPPASSAAGAGDWSRRLAWLRHELLLHETVACELLGDLAGLAFAQERSLEHLDRAVERFPGDLDFRRDRARVQASAARRRGFAGDLSGARQGFTRSLEQLDGLLAEQPGDELLLSMRIGVAGEFASVLAREGRWTEVVPVALAALPLHDRLEQSGQVTLPDRTHRVDLLGLLGRALVELGERAEGARLLEAARVGSRQLQQEHPDDHQLVLLSGNILASLAGLDEQRGQPEQALARASEQEQLFARAAARWPGAVELVAGQAQAASEQSRLLRERLGRLDEAHPPLARAWELWQGLAGRLPAGRWHDGAAALTESLARVDLDRGEAHGAARAAAALAGLEGPEPADRLVRAALLSARALDLARAQGRDELAPDLARQALDLLERAEQRGPPGRAAVSAEPGWRALRDEPRYQALLARLEGP